MNNALRVALLIHFAFGSLFWQPFLRPVSASQWSVQRHIVRPSSSELPFLSLHFQAFSSERGRIAAAPFRQAKLRFVPGRILGRPVPISFPQKANSVFSSRENRRKRRPREPFKKPHTGIVVELEGGHGNHHTFIGRLQHGTQFKNAHYYLQGHWEKTNGKDRNKHEEILSGQVSFTADISKTVESATHGTYFHSEIELPQFSSRATHKKSAIALITELTTNITPETSASLLLSGERSEFIDHESRSCTMDRYGGQLEIKQHWDTQNTLKFLSKGFLELNQEEGERFDTKYHGTSTLTNVFTLYDTFTLEAGVLFDHYHSQEFQHTRYFIAPIATSRLRFFGNTTLFATYSPHLAIPDFNELYMQRLYTLINQELFAETVRHDFESGIQQRFGDQISLRVSFFYQEREDLLVQADTDHNNLLEYTQPGSASFMGIRANLQMNFLERLVQSTTYTYTRYDVTSLHLPEADADYFQDTILPYQPKHQVQASIYWLTPLGFAIDFNGIYQSEQHRSWQREQNRIGQRFFLNVALIQNITENLQIYLLGRNLIDTDIYDIIPMLDSREITSSQLFIGGVRGRF